MIVGAILLASCASVLGLRDHLAEQHFPHRKHLFAGVGCPTCHSGISEPGLHLPSASDCKTCHTQPHTEAPCLDCHAEVGGRARAIATAQHLRFEHGPHLPVVKMSCGRCHLGVPEDRTPTPAMSTCLSCHPHQEAYDVKRCDQCHVDLPAEAVRPASHAIHGLEFTARHGAIAGSQRDYCATCHAERDCLACHGTTAPMLPGRLAFERTELGQASLHRAGFRARHAIEARATPGTCTACHSPASCADCHTRSGIGAKNELSRGPHPIGWVGAGLSDNTHGRAARLDPASCASCHGGAGEQLCVSCHAVGKVGGSIHPPGWKSDKRVSELPCRQCHLGGHL